MDALYQRMDGKIDELLSQRRVKDFYSVREVAERVGRSAYQVREWCKRGRCRAEKRKIGRGGHAEWMIPHEELLRLESDGPLPEGRV
jgi:transposase